MSGCAASLEASPCTWEVLHEELLDKSIRIGYLQKQPGARGNPEPGLVLVCSPSVSPSSCEPNPCSYWPEPVPGNYKVCSAGSVQGTQDVLTKNGLNEWMGEQKTAEGPRI